jgi:hypothetical protein
MSLKHFKVITAQVTGYNVLKLYRKIPNKSKSFLLHESLIRTK